MSARSKLWLGRIAWFVSLWLAGLVTLLALAGLIDLVLPG